MKNYKATRATMMQWGKKNVVAKEGEAGKKKEKKNFSYVRGVSARCGQTLHSEAVYR